jgi:hypothetical protein
MRIFFLATFFAAPVFAAEEWPESGAPAPKGWKSQRICNFDIYYPQKALLDVSGTLKQECPSLFSLALNGPAISFDVSIIESGDWRTEAVKGTLSLCAADGPGESQYCNESEALVETFRVDGQRALKINAPITRSPAAKRLAFTFYVAELPQLDERERPRVVVAYVDSAKTIAVKTLDVIFKALRFRKLGKPSADQEAYRANDKEALYSAGLAKPRKEVRKFGDYVFEATYPTLKECILREPGSFEVCNPETLPARVYDSKRRPVIMIDEASYRHYHPFEVHGERVFWIRRTGDTRSSSWTDELWVAEVAVNKRERLGQAKGLDFRASPDGSTVFYLGRNSAENVFERLMKVDVSTKETTTVFEVKDKQDTTVGMKGFSKGGEAFLFSIYDGPEEDSCIKAGTYRNGRITWAPCS